MRKTYFGPRGMTRNERRLGRYIRDGEGHPGGGGGDNGSGGTSVTSDDSGTNTDEPDNTGQALDANAFWANPEQQDGGDQSQTSPTDVGTEIRGMLDKFQAKPIFDAEVAKQVSEGNLEGVNKNFQEAIRSSVQQSVVMTAHILKAFEASMEARISEALRSNNTQQSDESLLRQNFQAYKEPAMQPVIQQVFQQALKNTKNDRAAALEMTKGMLKIMGQTGQSDFGINSAPSNPDDYMGSGPQDLVRSLLESR